MGVRKMVKAERDKGIEVNTTWRPTVYKQSTRKRYREPKVERKPANAKVEPVK